MKLYIGTSGWSYDHWIKNFYPEKLPRKEWLKFYIKNFNTVEMNMSFYRFPTKEILASWKEKFPKKFLMTVKANRQITHLKRFRGSDDYLEDFYTAVDELGGNLGCILFQAPPFFKFTKEHFERIKKFLKKIDRNKKNVFEFRHESWWNKKVFDLFKKENITFCSVSGFSLPDGLIETSETAYIRFHGIKSYTSSYTKKQLSKWTEKIKKSNAKEIFCYFNNDANANSAKNAKTLIDLMKQK